MKLYQDQDPTLGRLELAKRVLRSGYAFPTNHYLVTDELWQSFQEAIQNQRGGFDGTETYIHP